MIKQFVSFFAVSLFALGAAAFEAPEECVKAGATSAKACGAHLRATIKAEQSGLNEARMEAAAMAAARRLADARAKRAAVDLKPVPQAAKF